MLTKIFRFLYLFVSWIFAAGLVAQVYTAGLAAVSKSTGWGTHGGLGFALVLTGLLQLLLVRPARLPRPAGWVSLGLFAALLLQLVVLTNRTHVISALHPVLALIVFYMAWWLAAAAFRSVRMPVEPVLDER